MSKNRKRAAIEELNSILKVKRSRTMYDEEENEQEYSPELDNPDDLIEDEDCFSDEDDIFNEEKAMEKLKEEDEEAYNNLVLVKEELQRTEPDIKTILKSDLRLEDKAKLCQYYEMYKTQTPNTEEWLGARDLVNEKHKEFIEKNKQYQQYTPAQHKDMEEACKKYTTFNTHVALKYKILNLQTSDENKEYIFTRFEELQQMETHDDEYTKLKNWLYWATELPYDKMKKIPNENMKDLMQNVSKRMDKELYGMEKVKEQLLVFIHAKLTNPDMKRCNLGLIGPPGVGKTAVSRLLAKILKFPFEQISFGGIDKPDFLKGHEYTYVGAQPGAITRALKKMGYKNGILYFDEYEKISDNKDICSALLHICDPEQQEEFTDLFLNMKQDLRYLWMIYSMNSLPDDSALADRIFPIYIEGYTQNDMINIIRDHLLPKALHNAALESGAIHMDREVTKYLINRISKPDDKGVRTIEKTIIDIVNKIKFLIAYQDEKGDVPLFKITFQIGKPLTYPVHITEEILSRILDKKELTQAFLSMYL